MKIRDTIVLEKHSYNYMRMAICFSLAILINCLIVIYNLYNNPVTRYKELPPITEYVESFVPVYQDLTADDFKQINCVAMNIYHEARGEHMFGKLMVGFVTKNRVESKDFPNDYCSVVYQEKNNVAQFSWINDGKSDIPKEKDAWNASLAIAFNVMYRAKEDLSQGALYYHKNNKTTKFSKTHYERINKIGVVGQHVLFKPKDNF